MKEHAKYLNILPQMGLTPETVPADLRLQIYQKLGLLSADDSESSKVAKKPVLKDTASLKKLEDKKLKKRK